MLKSGLFHLLSTTSAITAICGTRIYPELRPTGPLYPLIEFKKISKKANPTLDTSGMQRDRYQFDCCAQTDIVAEQLCDVLRQTLNGYQGVLSDGTHLQNAIISNENSSYTDMPRIYCDTIEFLLLYNFTN